MSASESPRVAPRLTIATGIRACRARCTKRSPDITVSDDPSTSRQAESSSRSKHRCTRGPGYVLAEEHDVGLEQIGSAALTTNDPEPRDLLVGELSVSVRVAGRDLVRAQIGVGGTQPLIKRLPGAARAALQAHDTVKCAMQLQDVSGAGGLMQPVDILGDDPVQHTRLLHRGHCPVSGVGSRGGDPPPADMSAAPVSVTSLRRAAKLSDRHRQPGTQRAARTAIVRDS
jgi:hypothetical protein